MRKWKIALVYTYIYNYSITTWLLLWVPLHSYSQNKVVRAKPLYHKNIFQPFILRTSTKHSSNQYITYNCFKISSKELLLTDTLAHETHESFQNPERPVATQVSTTNERVSNHFSGKEKVQCTDKFTSILS